MKKTLSIVLILSMIMMAISVTACLLPAPPMHRA